jgi:hypothetical protein
LFSRISGGFKGPIESQRGEGTGYMNLANWIPALSVTTIAAFVLALGLYLCRDIILAWLSRKVQFGVEEQLEQVRADLRKSEERLKSELRSNESEIAALREVALGAMASRRAALDKRRLEAVEKVWASVCSFGSMKLSSAVLAQVDVQKMAKAGVTNAPGVADFFKAVIKPVDPAKLNVAADERPFVSPKAWALFTAYQAILVFDYMQVLTLSNGLDASKFITNKKVDELIKAALPHFSDFVDKFGAGGYYYVLDPLEQQLLDELRKMLDGSEIDAASVADAAKILQAAKQVFEVAKAPDMIGAGIVATVAGGLKA